MTMAGFPKRWIWNPTKEQKKVFEEWRDHTIGYLVSSREGTNIRSIPRNLEESTGEDIPLDKMGFRTINQFLYEMSSDIEVRTLDNKLFVFMRDNAVPAHLQHIRKLVLGQAKDKSCKTKTGVIKRPTKNQSAYARPEQLLTPVMHIINRPGPVLPQQRPTSTFSSGPMRRPGGSTFSGSRYNSGPGTQQRRNPMPPRFSNNNATRSPITQVRRSPQQTATTSISNRPQQTTATSRPPLATRVASAAGGKENDPGRNLVTPLALLASRNSTLKKGDWGGWEFSTDIGSSPGSAGVMKPSNSTAPFSAPPGPGRLPRLPPGLIETESESDHFSSDEEFECSGPPLAQMTQGKKAAFDQPDSIQTTIRNPSGVETSNKPPISSVPINGTVGFVLREGKVKPKSEIVDKLTEKHSSYVQPKQPVVSPVIRRITRPAPVVPVLTTPQPPLKPVVVTHVSHNITKPSPPVPVTPPLSLSMDVPVSSTAQHGVKGVTSNESNDGSNNYTKSCESAKPVLHVAIDANEKSLSEPPMPLKGMTLDTEDCLRQYRRKPAIQIAYELPDIKLPTFLRGGSLHSNFSLKAYLSTVGSAN